jgi:hypothetical protein
MPDPVVQSAKGAVAACFWPSSTGPNVRAVIVVDLEQLVSAGFCGTMTLSCADCPLLCSVATRVWELPTAHVGSVLIVASNVPSLLIETAAPADGAVVVLSAPSKKDADECTEEACGLSALAMVA